MKNQILMTLLITLLILAGFISGKFNSWWFALPAGLGGLLASHFVFEANKPKLKIVRKYPAPFLFEDEE